MRDLNPVDSDEICTHKKKLEKLLNFTHHTSLEGKVEMMKCLKKDPLYVCYFCQGYNYNCGGYEKIK